TGGRAGAAAGVLRAVSRPRLTAARAQVLPGSCPGPGAERLAGTSRTRSAGAGRDRWRARLRPGPAPGRPLGCRTHVDPLVDRPGSPWLAVQLLLADDLDGGLARRLLRVARLARNVAPAVARGCRHLPRLLRDHASLDGDRAGFADRAGRDQAIGGPPRAEGARLARRRRSRH